MFRQIQDFARHEPFVDLVFLQIRNLGVIGAVFSAAAWKETHVGVGWLAVWDHAVAAILFPGGIGLAWLNHQNVFHKVRNTTASKWLKAVFAMVYFVFVVELVRYMISELFPR